MSVAKRVLLGKGMIHAILLDGQGGGRRLGPEEVAEWRASHGTLWLHLAYMEEDTIAWMAESGLDPVVKTALLSESTRPRISPIGNGCLLNLRAINLNEGAEHEDMVSLRLWLEPSLLITTRNRRLRLVTDIASRLEEGCGPVSTADFCNTLLELIMEEVEESVEQLEERMDHAEDSIGDNEQDRIADIRRTAMHLRRHLGPQREALIRLQSVAPSWLDDRQQRQLHETTNHLIRIVENLDTIRDRALIAQEELLNLLSRQLNSRIYMLSIITAIFLPLSFVTGLLGINVAGIPFAESSWAFLTVVLVLLAIVFCQLLYFRRQKWF